MKLHKVPVGIALHWPWAVQLPILYSQTSFEPQSAFVVQFVGVPEQWATVSPTSAANAVPRHPFAIGLPIWSRYDEICAGSTSTFPLRQPAGLGRASRRPLHPSISL